MDIADVKQNAGDFDYILRFALTGGGGDNASARANLVNIPRVLGGGGTGRGGLVPSWLGGTPSRYVGLRVAAAWTGMPFCHGSHTRIEPHDSAKALKANATLCDAPRTSPGPETIHAKEYFSATRTNVLAVIKSATGPAY